MKTKTFTLYHTSDIHGALFPYNYALDQIEDIGLLKIKSYLETHRQSEDIIIDTGDILQGSPLAYYLSKQSLKNHPFSDVLNAMNYTAFTLGNHDFNFGKNTLKSFTNILNAPILNANILKNNLPWIGQKTLIKELSNGLTIGIIGVTTHYIPKWENPFHIEGLEFKDGFETLKEEVKNLRDIVDLLIVNYHGGFEGDLDSLTINQFTGENQGIKIIKEIPEIDILLTGHQHQILTQKVGNTYVSQPGQKGEVLNAITIHASLDEKWTFEYEGSSIKCDQENISLKGIKNIQTVHHQTLNYLEQVIGEFDQDYLIEDPIESRVYATPIASWINQMQLEETNAELSLCSLGNEVTGFHKEVTLKSFTSLTYEIESITINKSLTDPNKDYVSLEDFSAVIAFLKTSLETEMIHINDYDQLVIGRAS